MKNPRDVILEPVVSEKSYDLIEDHNTYTFIVHPTANKTEIKQAVQAIFDVKVASVNTMNRRGKNKRTGWKWGKRPDVKRALVTLAPGDEIDIFGV